MHKHACGQTAVLLLSFAIGVCSAGESDSDGGQHFALKISGEATAGDAGLPAYPGSRPYEEEDQSTAAANFGLATSTFGIKLVAMNLETRDTPERVGAFYKRALSKYGNVLECTGNTDATASKPSEDSDELVCDADDPGTHIAVYKVGTEDNQRIVAIEPHGNGTRFSVVHVDTRGKSKR